MLAKFYTELDDVLALSREQRERISGSRIPGLPLDERALGIRSDIVSILASWAGLIVESLRVEPPRRIVPMLVRFLLSNLDWLAEHEAAGSVAEEVDALVRRCRRALSGDQTRQIPLGPCICPGCGGTLAALVRGTDSMVRCDAAAEHRWRPEQWHLLCQRRGCKDGIRATDITAVWGVATGTVYWLANVNGWRRYRDGSHVYYHLGDVTDSLSQASLRRSGQEGVSAHRRIS